MATGKEWNIIIAEDDPDDLYLFNEGLSQAGVDHILHHVDRGEEVIPALKFIRPDIIFLDFHLPGITGLECLGLIKADPTISDIPVIIVSTSSRPSWVKESYQLGAIRYFVKPVKYDDISIAFELIFSLSQEELKITPPKELFVI